jgi:hypothetical protein
MTTHVTLYPINGVTESWQDDPFDHSKLPVQIIPDVTIENVKAMFNEQTFSWVGNEMGKRDKETLTGVKYAIVHRFEVPHLDTGQVQQQSVNLVNSIAAYLRLIRPMRQFASLMVGTLRSDGTIEIQTFDHPVHLMDVPNLQRGFFLRNRDVAELQSVVDEFLRGMNGEFWKFKMSVSFHDSGHFAVSHWKSRFMLWCSAVEAVYTSQNSDHRGTRVAKERIRWFLGEGTSIFMPGDIQSFMPKASYKVGNVVDDLYQVRNCIAHGERIPDRFFTIVPQGYMGEDGNVITVLHDGLSFIIRASLLRILKNNLLEHFADGPASERYFGAVGLTNSELKKGPKKSP